MTDRGGPDAGRRGTRQGRGSPPTTPDAVEIAMEAEASGEAPIGEASALLRRQSALIDEQIGLARNERFRNRIKAVRDGALAVLAIGLVLGAGWVVWDASRANGVVIEPFVVAPALVEQGVTGELVASRLLGRLSVMQAASTSNRRSRSTGGLSAGLAVEIPQTGVSVGEVLRLLRRRLGQETIVSGELLADAAGAPVLVVLVDGVRADPPTSSEPQTAPTTLEAALDRGAEAVFATTDTYRYATWLGTVDRLEERDALLRSLSGRGPPEERAWALNGLSVAARLEGRLDEAVALAREAIRMNPELINGHANLMSALGLLGRDEEALAAAERALWAWDRTGRALGQDPRAPLASRRLVAIYRADLPQVIAVTEAGTALARTDDEADQALRNRALGLAAMHDVAGSRAEEARSTAPSALEARRNFAIIRGLTLENWAQVEAILRAPATEPPGPFVAMNLAAEPRVLTPWLAYAVARQGRFAEATALAASLSTDCYLCVRARGMVASEAKDWRTADRWFAQAVRQGPSLPFAEEEWGRSRLARGDPAGAITLFRSAHDKGPRWADPLKYWGDALLAQGDEGGAIRKYRAAAERAPRWGALHLAWGRALWAQGRRDQARERWRAASGMDLSAADRAEVVRRLGARTG